MGKAIILENLDFSRNNIGSVTIRRNTPVIGLSISAEDIFIGEFLQLRTVYNPVDTTQVGVIWSIESGSEYATVDNYGKLTVLSAAEEAENVVVKAVSTFNSSVYATKTISVTYEHQSDELTAITIEGNSTVTGLQANYTAAYTPSNTWKTGVTWQIVSGSEYCSITNSGVLAIKEGASSSPVTIRATSIVDPTIYGEKQISVTYLDAIYFEDPVVKAICVQNWDTNNDGELSMIEAKAVTGLNNEFYNNTEITSFNEFRFFTNVTNFKRGGRGFQNCSNLRSIKLPASLVDIAGVYGACFQRCTSLEKIDISNVTSLGTFCFSGCTALTEVLLNQSLTSIPASTFASCSNLVNVNLPDTITSIGGNAFGGCTSLKSLHLPSALTTIYDGAFSGCSILELSSLPTKVTSIGKAAFRNCNKITISVIPEGVTSIGNDCFMGCSAITELTLPSTITSIGSRAIYDMSSITKVICLATTPPTLGATTSIGGSWPIYVPDASLTDYQTAWSSYTSRLHGISELN